MAKPPRSYNVNPDRVRALLARYSCPVPFHAVRTRFLGNIASPVLTVSPLEAVSDLWGGDLPEFESDEAINELMTVLVMGLWNSLARHQERNAPFRLVRLTAPVDRESLASALLVRSEEVAGFIDGLFGRRTELDLPERAHTALRRLGEMRALFQGAHLVCSDTTKAASESDVANLAAQLAALCGPAEHEMHETVLACTRARRDMLRGAAARKPTLH